jgi:hypothetical protein
MLAEEDNVMTVHVGPSLITSHLDDQILVCDPAGVIQRHDQLVSQKP